MPPFQGVRGATSSRGWPAFYTGDSDDMRILLVEDDVEAAGYLVKGLTESGHVVEHAADGEHGLQLAVANAFDSMIIDRMLPKRDGLSLIEELRRMGNMTPVLILSALDDVDERVTGLKAGGDDLPHAAHRPGGYPQHASRERVGLSL